MREELTNWTHRKIISAFKYKIKITIKSIIILFLFLSGYTSAIAETISWGIDSSNKSFFLSHTKGVENLNGDNKNHGIQLHRLPFPLAYEQQLESLYIPFDKRFRSLKAGEIIHSNYKFKVYEDSINESGSFEQPAHTLLISPAEYLFLNNSYNTGDFSIYFRIRPYQMKRHMDIIQKAGIFGGQKQGMVCSWEGNVLLFDFINFFWSDGVPLAKTRVSTKDTFYSNRFQSVMLQYKQGDGSLTLYLNGIEQEKKYLTTDSTKYGTILTPKFHRWDRSPLIIGKDYLGALDDMLFTNSILPTNIISGNYESVRANGMLYIQKPGVAISKRIELPTSGSHIQRIEYTSQEPEGTSIRFYVRYSDIPFAEKGMEDQFPYKRVKKGKSFSGRGKYIQWKAELFSDAMGKKTPVLKGISIDYRENPAPEPPGMVRIQEVGNREVTLYFMRSLEMDVIKGGRYHIYYGIEPYEPLGVLKYKEFKTNPKNGKLLPVAFSDADRWITDDPLFQNRIKVRITNEMITKNFSYYRGNPKLLYKFPLLQKDIPYYFWVTTCDNAWTEAPHHSDHESKPSNIVVVRPH